MIEYMIELVDLMEKCRDGHQTDFGEQWAATKPDYPRLLETLSDELQRLDPRDFEPKARVEFLSHRSYLLMAARNNSRNYDMTFIYAAKVKQLLDLYRGEGSGAKQRDFTFVTNSDIRAIIQRDYRELDQRAFPDGAWKSSLVLSGSILEAVLYNALTKDQTTAAKAMSSPLAPKKNKGTAIKDIMRHGHADQWTLNDLIKVSCDLNIIRQEDESTIHRVLRDFRNFIHPRLEVENGIRISEAYAMAAKGMLDIILDHLSP